MRVAATAARPWRPARSSLAAFVLLAACGADPPDPPDTGIEFEVELGSWDVDTLVFDALDDGQQVELVAGFQGLVFVNLALRAPRDIPARFTAEGEIVFEDIDERYPFYDAQVLFEPAGDDFRVVPSFRVPFGLPASELDGRVVRFVLRLDSQRDDWFATLERRFAIHDGDCVHTPEGQVVCE